MQIYLHTQSHVTIILINRFYSPDHSATAQLASDLAQSLIANGQSVSVITSRKRYDDPTVKLPPREQLHGVTIHRVWATRFGRNNLIGRAFDYGSFYCSATLKAIMLTQKNDIIIAKTDPPLLSVGASITARLKKAKLINWCQDLFPEIAQSLGINWLKGFAGTTLKKLRNASLKQAYANVALHKKMADKLAKEGIPPETIVTIPNWCDTAITPPMIDLKSLRKDWGYSEECVIGYSGNLGRAHMPDKIGDLIEATNDIPNLRWLFIGGGIGMDQLKERVSAKNIKTVDFHNYQPREKLSESLSVPDYHLISLDPDCEGYIVPSKFYGALAVKRPVIFLGAPDGAIANDINEPELGLTLDASNSAIEWRETLSKLTQKHTTTAQKIFENNHSKDYLASQRLNQWQALISSAIKQAAPSPAQGTS